MKKLFILLAVLTPVLLQAASPKFIGRRGSLYGVENTAEAFRNGAGMGYDYLECHVRLSSDSVFVAAHDGKTTRLGGRMKVEAMPLDSLRSETYTQFNGDITYKGTICTVGEFLDICRETGVFPLLHLKKIKGINDKDCSMVPALIDLIRSKGYTDEVIILASMPGVCDYIQKNYPSVKVMFQADEKWPERFDYCVDGRYDVDIKKEALDETTIPRFHEKGLKVMTWTVNSIPEYLLLRDAGIDYVITDNLPARSLR